MSSKTKKSPPRYTKNDLLEETERLRNYFGFGPEEFVEEIYQCGLRRGGSSSNSSKGNLYLTGPQNLILYRKKGSLWRTEVREVFYPQNIECLEKTTSSTVHIVYETEQKGSLKKRHYTFTNLANSDILFKSLKKRSTSGNTPLHQASDPGSGRSVDYDLIAQILHEDNRQLGLYDPQGRTPLHIAVARNDVRMFQMMFDVYLKNRELIDINEKDSADYTLLHIACSVKRGIMDEIIEPLLELDDIEVNVRNSAHNIPLHYYCKETQSLRCRKIINKLVKKGSDVNALNMNNESPLHYAVLNNRVRTLLIQELWKHNCNTVNIRHSESGETPLHYCVRLRRPDVGSILVEMQGDISITNNSGLTPLDVATRELEDQGLGNDEYLRLLEVIKFFNNVQNLIDMLEKVRVPELFQEFVSRKLYISKNLVEYDFETSELPITVGSKIILKKEIKILEDVLKEEEEAELSSQKKEAAQAALFQNGEIAMEDLEGDLIPMLRNANVELQFSDLEFIELLGEGAAGQVFSGLYKGNKVAIKVLTAENIDSEVDEFKKELEILMSVKSELMIKFFGATLVPKLCMVMELCEQGSLHGYLNKVNHLPMSELLSFVIDMAEGIAFLHEMDPPIIHRDLKSLNLLITEEHRVKVCDFGLAREEAHKNLQTFKELRGTFAYCAPEVFNGGVCTAYSDVYSMGIVLWEILFVTMNNRYEQPFEEYGFNFDFQIIVQSSKGLRPNIPQHSPDPLVQSYLRCINENPEERPTARQFATVFAQIREFFEQDEEAFMENVYTEDVKYVFDSGDSKKPEDVIAFSGW
eukprot:TRINITY_DN3841_c0_g1_i1.p1 TRINITY_DN3841_c0_g1~~TRINITY_DN3841_c0_g1_i1.p1  ORF type:complete len:810 (-),score=165.20 TRINITY_DN3841_c0_g1_i1:147-2576(-)